MGKGFAVILILLSLVSYSGKSFSQGVEICSEGPINDACLCNEVEYSSGYCCNEIWFDGYYNKCPEGTYYFVDPSHPSANDSNLGTESEPLLTPQAGANKLTPGDVLIIKEGTYSRNTGTAAEPHRGEPGIHAVMDGTEENPIIIKAYPGDDVQLIGGIDSGTPTLSTSPTEFVNPAIGTEWDIGTDYIIIDGFKVYGAATLGNTTGSVLKNCDIWGGGDSEFGCCIRVEEATNCNVRNNEVHDNVNSGTSNGSPLLMGYDSTNVIIENNEFYNADTHAILYKDDPESMKIRYNIFRDNPNNGIWMANQDQGHNVEIYQNIFKNNGYDGFDDDREAGVRVAICVTDVLIYNNLFIDNVDDIANIDGEAIDNEVPANSCVAPNWSSWNNIFSNPSKHHYTIKNPGEIGFLDYSDYNFYQSTLIWHDNINYEGLATWQGHSGMDLNSLSGDPLFDNTADYKLSAGSTALNAGIDRQDYNNNTDTTENINMGPYITGNEVIGIDPSANPFSFYEDPGKDSFDITVSGGCMIGMNENSVDVGFFGLLILALVGYLFIKSLNRSHA